MVGSAERPATHVAYGSRQATIVVDQDAARYVSRAVLKLRHALDHFGYDPAGLPHPRHRSIDRAASPKSF